MKKDNKPNIGLYLSRHKLAIFLYVLFTVLGAVGGIGMTLLLAEFVESITLPNFFWKAFLYMGLVICTSIVQRCFWWLSSYVYHNTSIKIRSELNMDLAKQAFKLNTKTFNDHDTGHFVNRIVYDPTAIIDNLSYIIDLVVEVISSVVILIYITFLNVYLALLLIFISILAYFIERHRVKVRKKCQTDVKKKEDMIVSLTTEIVRSEKDIKSMGLENELSEISGQRYASYQKACLNRNLKELNLASLRNFVVHIGSFLAILFGLYLMDKGLLTLATLMIVYSNRSSMWSMIYSIGQITNCVIEIKVCHNRIFSLFDEDEFVTEKFGNNELKDSKSGRKIEFKKVGYTFLEWEYPQKTGKRGEKTEKKLVSKNQLFKDLSFKVQPNTTVAFVGKSGSGKSTIMNLMCKMLDADNGKILIDGIDIQTLSKKSLRSTISMVNQFPYIFDMTIKENLLLAKKDATDDDLMTSLKQANLDEFVSKLPKGINTRVGEGGIKLSGGEKQRLAIARALLRNSSIILFDESTSSLDNFAQEEIKKSIDGLKGKSTVIIVAHRLSTIKNVDKIFFLDEGKIVDEGTFDELFEKNKKFKSMFLAENI